MILFSKLYSTFWLLAFCLLLGLLPRWSAVVWLLGTLVALYWRRHRELNKLRISPTVPVGPPPAGTNPPLLSATPEIIAALEKNTANFAAIRKTFFLNIPAIQLLPVLGILLALVGLFFKSPQGCAGVALFFGIVNLLIFAPALLVADRKLRRVGKLLETRKRELLDAAPRPPCDADKFATRYPDGRAARLAAELIRIAQPDFLPEPGDSWCIAAGKEFFPVWHNLQKYHAFPLKDHTLGELVQMRLLRGDFPQGIPEALPSPLAPPPWTDFLSEHFPANAAKPLPCRAGKKFWQSRPPFNAAEFVQYWPSRREAENALTLLHLVRQTFDRPQLPMVYPNDPMGLYDYWAEDSLDDVEFIMALEEEFGIEISAAEAEKMFTTFTVSECVQLLSAKEQSGHDTQKEQC